MSIAQSDIRQVKVKRGPARLRNGAIGAAIGAVSGVLIVVALDGALTDGDGTSEEGAAILGAAGAGIGFALGMFAGPGYSTIYKAH
jgi:hypothetical protein